MMGHRQSLLNTSFSFNSTYFMSMRFFLLHKLGLLNVFAIPDMPKLELFVYIDNAENFRNNRILGSFLLLYFVTGFIPVISRFRVFQSFKKVVYSVTVSVTLRKQYAGDFLLGFSYYLMRSISPLDFNFRFFQNYPRLYAFVLEDWFGLKSISVHPAFFRWRENVFGKLLFTYGFSSL